MKKLFNFALFGAMALTGAVGFSACSSSDDVVNNPDFDPETNTVKTQFAISLPSNVHAPQTRMSSTTVQEAVGSFRGMQDIILLPFSNTTINSATKLLGDPIVFSDNIAASGLTALSGETATGGNYKVFNDVTVPMGTSAFIFYAQALATGGTEFINGKTVRTAPTGEGKAGTAGYTFNPQMIFSGDATSTSDNKKGTDIATYLTSIATVSGWKGNANLGGLYNEFVKMTAGSSAAVQRVVTDLWNSLKNNSDDLSKAIVTAITNSTYASVSSSTLSLSSDISGYPANLNLPDGAAAVKWDDTNNKFEVDNSGNTVGSLNAYVYPASLWYTVNTPIRVATEKKADESGVYKSGNTAVATWNEALTLYGTSNGSVSSTTRSIALVNPIQYAVGRFDVSVKCANTLKDQQGTTVNVPTDGFPVTAVLIGGQKAVDFAFTNPSGNEYTIYDNAVTGVSAKAGSADGTNYTLALETVEGTDVNIAVEFENTSGVDFYGKNGQVIPAGGKFYLTATLTASAATQTGSRVFKQDYYTTAILTIVEGSASTPAGLGVATNTIPDLRTPQLELGMSVNLEWQAGHEYDINFNN
jgi:hypothetical protein